LASTRPGFYVSAVQALIDDKTLKGISELLSLDVKVIEERLKMEKNPFMPVKIAHDISYQQLSKIEENMDMLKGIEVGVEPLRNYLYGEHFCHALGYVGEISYAELRCDESYSIGDYIGKMGIEEYYEKYLRGTDGVDYIEVDVRGREVGKIAEKRLIPPVHGNDLYTTIDFALQETVVVYLGDYKKAACVCLNPQNGEILVLYSKPGFDPNHFTHGLHKAEWQKLINDPDAPMYNRAIMSCYPCGSTFKPFVVLAALETELIAKEKRFEPCYGAYRLGRRIFKCWKKHYSLDLNDAVIYSCDIYFYQLGRLCGIDLIASKANEFGFGKMMGIDLPHEKGGLLPDRKWYEKKYGENWTEGHIFNLSIGQGDLLVTPLQLACVYTIFVNDGKIPIPHLKRDEEVSYYEINVSKERIAFVKESLLGVVAKGTGTLARIKEIEVCGKTGTAQNPHGEDHSIFTGFAPAGDPVILVCVLIENAGHGGSVAAPIAGKIMRSYLNRINQKSSVSKIE
jgi:penicillin-binding protein 2